jgi:hypothetical protein
MDTQKDFIHIDDLFRNAANGEEPERSGSWLHMKELLDKEMPVGTSLSGGRSLRRFIAPIVAAVILAGGGVGYYNINKDKTTTVELASAGKAPEANTATGDASHKLVASGNSRNEQPAGTNDGNNGDRGGKNAIAAATSGVDDNAGGGNRAAGTKGETATTADIQPVTPATRQPEQAKTRSIASAGKTRNSQQHPAHKTVIVPGKKANAAEPIAAAGNIEEERIIDDTPEGAVANGAYAIAAGTPTGNNGKSKQVVNSAPGKKLKQLAVSLNNKKIVADAEGILYKEERDTFKRIDLVERIVNSSSSGNSNRKRRGPSKTTLDTVAVTRIEKVRYVPLDRMELASLRKMGVNDNPAKLIPVTNLHERILSKETVSLVPLNHYKVASRKVDPGKFNQLVQNTSAGISNYFDGSRKFYAAILFGGNTSFGNPGAFGMQVGIAGLYSLGERLTLAAELRYVNHYFSNYSLDDKSVTFENVNSQQLSGVEWLFSGTQNTLTSSYKINSFSALEMPVTLSYNLGRVSLLAGLNVAYAFPIKWNKQNTYNTTNVQQTRPENQNPFLNSSFKVNERDDFASRLGLGYVWGLSYDFSRKVSLDARVSHILWDNGKGSTDAINRLFHIPAMQFSLGYYFGRKDKVVYIMDKNKR